MKDLSNIKGIIFDYGGTLDSRGVHWSEVIWQGYVKAEVPIDKPCFMKAYVFTERLLAKRSLVKPEYNFREMISVKVYSQLLYLEAMDFLPKVDICAKLSLITEYCYNSAKQCIEEARPLLKALKERYPMVIVSNFYGNLNSVLADFKLTEYFSGVIESAVVGVRKPDKSIFQLGINALEIDVKNVLVVGDNYRKDIEPAMSLGCKTAWLKCYLWGDEPIKPRATLIIKSLSELSNAIL